jgi:hypothetical protein
MGVVVPDLQETTDGDARRRQVQLTILVLFQVMSCSGFLRGTISERIASIQLFSIVYIKRAAMHIAHNIQCDTAIELHSFTYTSRCLR